MKTKEKLEFIDNKIKRLNERLKNRKFKAKFKNNGANNYCLEMKRKSYKFNTYDDLMNCLTFIDDMFENATKEINKK